ncbi:UrcA family protein [Sphingobium bisphenolivorans]|uniref:UrcA family protein n=1 Tax=Sphingobium bisphenolivorans TaxID=1335760 RepID=UPI0004835B8B|nr:UrcA family protein [Sphingobium bisphenolivorans]
MKIGLAALATIAFATSTIASAADNPFVRDQAILDLKGIDLATSGGQQRLAIRMDQAARAVCGDQLAGVHLAVEAKARECRTAVIADVRSQIEARTAMAPASASTRLAYNH